MKDFFNKETLDNIKQFCTENKKYVGVAAILIGLILMLIVVVAGGNNGRHSDTESESQAEISVKDFEFEKDYTNDAKDDINTLLADYYKAYVSDDLDTLGKLATPMSDNEKSYIGVVSQYYESVNDITPYTKNGLKKGSYFVSVKNSIKFTGVDTQAPTLDFFYIETGKDGKLFINNVYSNFNRTYCENELDNDIMELISKYTASSEFADLHEEVQKEYEQALGADANLKTMLETTLTGSIKQWYTSSGIANLKKSDADTQTTEADTQQADDASQNSEQQNTDANAGQTADQQTTDANAGQNADQQTTDANAGQNTDQQTTDSNAANQQPAEQPQAPAEYQVVTKDVVKVRDGASTDSKELGLLKEQVTLTAYGTEGDWTIVSYSDGTNGRAYIKTENLQTVGQ
nr:SH3 domain-containing protein [uncultured Agathobacter sp.]